VLKRSEWLGQYNLRYAAISTDGLGGALLEWCGGKDPGSVPLDDDCSARIEVGVDMWSDRETSTLVVRSAVWHQELRFRAAPFDPEEVVPTVAEWHGALIAARRGLMSSPGGRTALLAAPRESPELRRSRDSSKNASRTNLTLLDPSLGDE